jgi:hypothetical protein
MTLQTIIEQSMKLKSDKALNGRDALDKVMSRAS